MLQILNFDSLIVLNINHIKTHTSDNHCPLMALFMISDCWVEYRNTFIGIFFAILSLDEKSSYFLS